MSHLILRCFVALVVCVACVGDGSSGNTVADAGEDGQSNTDSGTGSDVARPDTSVNDVLDVADTGGTTPEIGSDGGEEVSILDGDPDVEPEAYVYFAINVHDWVHVSDSADTILRLIDIFERYDVRGDFYFTSPMVQFYVEQRPDVVQRLAECDQTVSYHVRPPHPTYTDFDSRLRDLDDETLEQTLRDYETYRLDLETGDLFYDQPGGYTFVADQFGRNPVVVSGLNQRWHSAGLPLFDELGAGMTVTYHEDGTDLEQPFELTHGLLIRPSDFSVTRWTIEDRPGEPFWWNMMNTDWADQYEPALFLQQSVDAWSADRPPFVTALIHENNFYRQSSTPWALVFYEDTDKTIPRDPPFDLDAPDASTARTEANMEQIWTAYEALVAFAAEHYEVVTSEDLVEMAEQVGGMD